MQIQQFCTTNGATFTRTTLPSKHELWLLRSAQHNSHFYKGPLSPHYPGCCQGDEWWRCGFHPAPMSHEPLWKMASLSRSRTWPLSCQNKKEHFLNEHLPNNMRGEKTPTLCRKLLPEKWSITADTVVHPHLWVVKVDPTKGLRIPTITQKHTMLLVWSL